MARNAVENFHRKGKGKVSSKGRFMKLKFFCFIADYALRRRKRREREGEREGGREEAALETHENNEVKVLVAILHSSLS